jgi:type II secretory pathway pseudopilin PulG
VQGFLAEERASARLGLVIAAIVIALLAAAAVPLVFGQAHNAQDARAQSNVAELAARVQACRVDSSGYGACDERAELRDLSAVRWGRGPGEAGVLRDRSTEGSFTAYAVSGSGRQIYVWAARDAQVAKHTCRHGSVPRLEREGCDGPGW